MKTKCCLALLFAFISVSASAGEAPTKFLFAYGAIGGNAVGSSRLPVVTSMVGTYFVLQYVKGVPQRPQKVRVTAGDDLNSTGLPGKLQHGGHGV